jgi:hypothetical protein
MVKSKLNRRYFNSRNQLLRGRLIDDIKNIIESNYRSWGVKYRDIDSIFIFGNNINGEYSQNEPFIISFYINPEKEFLIETIDIIENLERELLKIQLHKNDQVSLVLVDFDPTITLNSYFDIKKNYYMPTNPTLLAIKRRKISELEKKRRREEIQENVEEIEENLSELEETLEELTEDYEELEEDIRETQYYELQSGSDIPEGEMYKQKIPAKLKKTQLKQEIETVSNMIRRVNKGIKKKAFGALGSLGFLTEEEVKKGQEQ